MPAVRLPSIRHPQSLWDVLGVLFGYFVLEYLVLFITESSIVRQGLIVVASLVILWQSGLFYEFSRCRCTPTDRRHGKRSYSLERGTRVERIQIGSQPTVMRLRLSPFSTPSGSCCARSLKVTAKLSPQRANSVWVREVE